MNNQIKAIAIVLLLWLVTSIQVSAQHLSDRYFGISEQDFTDTIKITMWDGAIIIPVEIEGETKNLMFDTGAGMGFWIGGVEEWMRPTGDNYTIYDAQDRKKETAIMEIPSIKMGNLTIKSYH